jgi:hypothetical protein
MLRRDATRRALGVVAVLGLVATTAPQPAHAQTDSTVRMAGEAYDRGAAAYDAGDYAAAAREFARADALAPNPVALELAIRSATRIDDAPFAMLLVERAERRGATDTLAEIAAETRAALAAHVANIQVLCPARRVCRAALDGEPIAIGVRRWVKPGDHAIELTVDGKLESKHVHVEPQEELVAKSLVPPAPEPSPSPAPPPPSAAEPEPSGAVSPWWCLGAGVLTAVAGGVLVGSAVDTKNKYDAFQQAQPPTVAMQDEGRAAQLRTNIFVGVTAALGAATLATGLLAVRWSGDSPSNEGSTALELSAGPSSLHLTAHFR